MINYDAEGKPLLPPELFTRAKCLNMVVFGVIAGDLNSPTFETDGVTFWCIGSRVPVVGEYVILEDQKRYKVIRVDHKVGTVRDEDGKATMIPATSNVIAQAVD